MEDQTIRYRHRLNLDGTYDAICLHCFLTAAHAPTEKKLEALEKIHDCSLMILDEWDTDHQESKPEPVLKRPAAPQ